MAPASEGSDVCSFLPLWPRTVQSKVEGYSLLNPRIALAQEPATNGEEVTGYRVEIDDGSGGPFDLAWHGTDLTYEALGLVVLVSLAHHLSVLHVRIHAARLSCIGGIAAALTKRWASW